MARHPVLALDRGTRGLVLCIELHMRGVFLGDRRQCLVGVELGERISLDLEHDLFQMPPALDHS